MTAFLITLCALLYLTGWAGCVATILRIEEDMEEQSSIWTVMAWSLLWFFILPLFLLVTIYNVVIGESIFDYDDRENP